MTEFYGKYVELKGNRSDYEIAKESGIPYSTIAEWRSGKKCKPNIINLKKLADYFQVPMEAFL